MSKSVHYLLAGVFCAGVFSAAAFAGATVSTLSQGVVATYAAGNLDDFTAGTEGKLALSGDGAAFSVGKAIVMAPYKQIQNVELGDVIEQKRKGFHVSKRPLPGRRQVTLSFSDPQSKLDRTATLEMDEDEATAVVEQVELKTGRRRRVTNGDSWWGDSAWKTKRNGNSVKPEALGDLENK